MIAERLSWAMQPGDLRLRADKKMGRAEYLIALGYAGIHHRVASKLYRLIYSPTSTDYAEALKAVECVVSHLAVKRRWTTKPHNYKKIAGNALKFILQPACPVCEGRGYDVIEGTSRLSDRVCNHCHGTGRRRIDTRQLSEVITELERFEEITLSAVRRKIFLLESDR